MISYEAKFQLDLGNTIPEVGDLLDRLNTHLATMGCDERISAGLDVFSLKVSMYRELQPMEETVMKKALQESVASHLSEYSVKLVSFRRKSGNVQQSVT